MNLNWIKGILEDNSGGASSARLLMLLWGVGVFIIWCYVSFHTGAMVALPETVITVLLGTSPMKVVQRFGEKPDTNSTDGSVDKNK